MTTYLDHAFRQNRATYACFRANGITGLARYYDGGRVQHKGLTLAEAQDIAAAGLRLHAVYETSGGADIDGFPQGGDYFTHPQGWRDWMEAVVAAEQAVSALVIGVIAASAWALTTWIQQVAASAPRTLGQ